MLVNQIKCKRLGESADFSWFRVLPDEISSIASKIENLNGSEEPKKLHRAPKDNGDVMFFNTTSWFKSANEDKECNELCSGFEYHGAQLLLASFPRNWNSLAILKIISRKLVLQHYIHPDTILSLTTDSSESIFCRHST